MSRPLAPPPAPPAAPEPQSRNARLRDSAIGFLSIFALFVALRIVLPEIPNGLFVAASGALGAFFAVNIAVIRRDGNARRERDENERGDELVAQEELVQAPSPEPAAPDVAPASATRRRGSAPAILSSQPGRFR